MCLVIIRHAEAIELGQAGAHKDADRFLTQYGRLQAYRMARFLKQTGTRPTQWFSSPFVRAVQTAECFQEIYQLPGVPLQCEPLLQPDVAWKTFAKSLASHAKETVFLFGHEPGLSQMIGWLMGKRTLGLKLAKGAAAQLSVAGPLCRGAGVLQSLITPEQLQSFYPATEA
jgi:phosphohistidine phosphatase